MGVLGIEVGSLRVERDRAAAPVRPKIDREQFFSTLERLAQPINDEVVISDAAKIQQMEQNGFQVYNSGLKRGFASMEDAAAAMRLSVDDAKTIFAAYDFADKNGYGRGNPAQLSMALYWFREMPLLFGEDSNIREDVTKFFGSDAFQKTRLDKVFLLHSLAPDARQINNATADFLMKFAKAYADGPVSDYVDEARGKQMVDAIAKSRDKMRTTETLQVAMRALVEKLRGDDTEDPNVQAEIKRDPLKAMYESKITSAEAMRLMIANRQVPTLETSLPEAGSVAGEAAGDAPDAARQQTPGAQLPPESA